MRKYDNAQAVDNHRGVRLQKYEDKTVDRQLWKIEEFEKNVSSKYERWEDKKVNTKLRRIEELEDVGQKYSEGKLTTLRLKKVEELENSGQQVRED